MEILNADLSQLSLLKTDLYLDTALAVLELEFTTKKML
jgi:hypothetical protein